ncbi:MAG: RidA family protein [Gemmatimonadota bacterium]|nr:RidA family protein [Gemmatimonadota bacterium]
MSSIRDRLRALEISLPAEPPPVVAGYVPAFAPFVRTGNTLHLSGRLAKKDGRLWIGKVGHEVTAAEGAQAARDIAVEMLAVMQAAVGDLEHITRVVRLMVFVNCTPQFTEPHVVANGASEVLTQVFGARGVHARSAVGVASTPFGACVEIDLVVEVADGSSRSEAG